MPTEQEYINYKDFVESLDEATPSANDKAVFNDANGPKGSLYSAIASFVLNLWAAFANAFTAKTSFASGDKIPIVNGSTATAMEASKLLELTAQNTLAGNVAPEFDPTRTSENPYKAGESVVYEGKVYTFKVDHYGAWVASDVYKHKENFVNENFVDISTAVSVGNSFIREIDGALDVTGSSDWRTYVFAVQPGEKYKVNLYSNSNYLAIAFLTCATVSNRNYISGIGAVGSFSARDYDFTVPDNCNYIVICNRYVSMPVPCLFCMRMMKSLPSELFEKNFIKVIDNYTGGIEYNGKVDVGCRVGYIENPSGRLYGESSYRTFFIKNKGYKSVEARVGLFGLNSYAISFFSGDTPSEKTFISGVVPIATSSPQRCYGVVPANCRSIAVCTRLQNLATPVITLSITPQGLCYGVPGEDVVEYSRLKRNSVIQQNWSWKGVDGQNEGKRTTLMWFSDIHGDAMAYQKMIKIKDWFFSELIADIVHTGDMYADKYEADKNFLGDYILNIPGNHDVYANAAHDMLSSPTIVYNALLKDRVENWSVTQPSDAESLGKNYYYKDYSASNVRVIFLDSQNYGGWKDFFDDEGLQDSWFASVLADAVTNEKNVVVVSHYPPGSISQSWRANGFCTPKDTFIASTFPGLARVEEFITNGGKFVCWMCAHQHDDQFGLCGTKQIPVIQIASENILRNENTARSFDSLSEHNFNFITFDTAKKLVKVTKYGCNLDSFMRARNAMCFDYENKVLISAN